MEQDFDRTIDQAAEQIAGGEPSDALTDAVMARVVDRRSSMVDGRSSMVVWAAAGAGVVAVGLVILLVLNRIPPQMTETPQGPPPVPAVAPQATPAPEVADSSRSGTERTAPMVQVARRVTLPQIAPEDSALMGTDPIAVESISSDPIDVPPVQIVAVDPIDQIQVEPLSIEPLSQANN